MITADEILKGQEIPDNLKENFEDLHFHLNQFRKAYDNTMIVSSGYRSPAHNLLIGGARNSAHCLCQACDFVDVSHSIRTFILDNPEILEECSLYCEDFDNTPTWVHLQTRVIPSGKRIFKP